jgi:hypothetical protein
MMGPIFKIGQILPALNDALTPSLHLPWLLMANFGKPYLYKPFCFTPVPT